MRALWRISSMRTWYRAYTSFSVRVGDFEIEFLVARIGLGLADVPRDAGAAQHRPGHAQVQHVFDEMNPTPLVRRIQMGFVFEQILRTRPPCSGTPSMNFRTTSASRAAAPAPARRPDVAGHHALAGEHFEDLENVLALAEAVEEHGHRAEVERVRAQPHQVAVDALQAPPA